VHDADGRFLQVSGECGHLDAPVLAGQRHLSRAGAEHLQRAALVGDDVGIPMAEDGTVGRHHRTRRDRVGRRSRGDGVRRELLGFEEALQARQGAFGPGICRFGLCGTKAAFTGWPTSEAPSVGPGIWPYISTPSLSSMAAKT
jgi:hypothetical protein